MGEEKGGGVAVEEEGMQCSKHPYKSNPNPGGICAFCLQEKLGKLVSSSNSSNPFFPLHPPPSSNNSSPPSFRSIDTIQPNITNNNTSSSSYASHVRNHRSRSSRISSFLTSASSHHPHQHKKKQHPPKSTSTSSSAAVAAAPALNLKRTKSVAPKPVSDNPVNPASIAMDSPRKKSFWSFLYLSSSSSTSTGMSASPHTTTATAGTSTANAAAMRRRSVSSYSSSRNHGHLGSTDDEGSVKRDAHLGAVVGEDESPSPGGSQSNALSSSFGRKVARSRSVGCGSRSFSGDFLERLSNGFGDCTLRRVESHRESNSNKSNKMVLPGQLEDNEDECTEAHRMRIRCSGFFSSSSSSSYWLSTAADGSARMSTGGVGRSHRGWGWAFASPMRAFRPPASSASSVKSMPSSSHLKATNGIRDMPQPETSTLTSAAEAALPPPVSLS
ncbi:hypothetical protein FCM35_KLT17936 [Carex littledalei]|uniref:Uncharacterized protein n=1 Tax=Carex littledalei TaxID=544730 RepID=A0A833VYA3_9POAL|nr:hypothetical protein FCM35_KLT17936 [Carex littledalei]